MRRTGRTWPTFAAELLRARASLRLGDEVGLAIRADRARRGLSQRAYAVERGMTEATVIRLESAAGGMKLGDIVAALSQTRFMLCLCHRPPNDEPVVDALVLGTPEQPDVDMLVTRTADPPGMDDDTRWPVVDDRGEAGLGTSLEREAEAAVTPTPVHPTFWPRAELLARVRGGRRRFPAHHVIEQVSYPPNWWWFAESSRAGAVEPDWYAPRYAQRRRSAS